jgi:hypothetical protein
VYLTIIQRHKTDAIKVSQQTMKFLKKQKPIWISAFSLPPLYCSLLNIRLRANFFACWLSFSLFIRA